jgi:formyltetrahydrofolate-dependent phosphoribosylglycinamide formyltransferase
MLLQVKVWNLSEKPYTLVVLVSGSGSNLQAIIDAIHLDMLDAHIACVVSNKQKAYALQRAKIAHIPTHYAPLGAYLREGHTREAYDTQLAQVINTYAPDLIVLAGWMHIVSADFLNTIQAPVINLHPALPGAFPGTNAIERAYEAYQRGEISESGCMVHHVIAEVDAGEVITQAVVPFEADESLEDYESRIHAAEHRIIVEAIGMMQKQHA